MKRKPQSVLVITLLLIALGAVLVYQNRVRAAPCRQQDLNNALLAAIPNHHIAAVRDLLRQGADPNCQQQPASLSERLQEISPAAGPLFHLDAPPIYFTPLVIAALNGQPDTVQALLAAGATVQQQDSSGETALDLAFGQDNITALLKNAEVKQ